MSSGIESLPGRSPTGSEPVPPCDRTNVGFRITEEMVTRFAALTGDYSSLHVSDAFARRSVFRRPVVHGMLPVGFLAVAAARLVQGGRCVPIAIAGSFRSPVHVGDRLRLSVEPSGTPTAGAPTAFAFRITREGADAGMTTGTLTIERRNAAAPRPSNTPAAGDVRKRMPLHPLEVNTLQLEEIEKGMMDRVDFAITETTTREFVDLLREGLDPTCTDELDDLSDRVYLPNLLAVLLFSTSVGVVLPGANATFLEFGAEVTGPISADHACTLRGEVVHRSAATRIVKKRLEITSQSGGERLLTGKVAALVAPPARRMPSVEELRASATDWGLEEKVVLVTGASRGIGETVAKLLALFGAKVLVNYHRGADDAARVVGEITDAGGEAFAVGADVTCPDEVARLVRSGAERYGTVDVLVNSAVRDFRPVPFPALTWEDFQRDLDVIVKGAFLCCQAVVPLMMARGGGRIINVASVAVDNPPADHANYVTAKSALIGLTRSLSIELASRNILVNAVVPNFVETDLVAHVSEGFRAKLARDVPLGRSASPIDVARAVLFLASSYSSYTTGQKVMVTGGGAPYL